MNRIHSYLFDWNWSNWPNMRRDWQNIELIIHNYTGFTRSKGQQETFIEPTSCFRMWLSTKSLMDILWSHAWFSHWKRKSFKRMNMIPWYIPWPWCRDWSTTLKIWATTKSIHLLPLFLSFLQGDWGLRPQNPKRGQSNQFEAWSSMSRKNQEGDGTWSIHIPNVFPRILSESLYRQYVSPPLSKKSEKASAFSGSSIPLCIYLLISFARFFLWLHKGARIVTS